MRYKLNFSEFITLILALLCSCQSSRIETPVSIGEKSRTGIKGEKQASEAINEMHGVEVAAVENLIAEYGDDKKDLLYISLFDTDAKAREMLDLMIQKIAHSKDGVFYHVMPLREYDKNAFITLGMGATNYVFISGQFLIWYQTYQSLGPNLPEELTHMYPVERMQL